MYMFIVFFMWTSVLHYFTVVEPQKRFYLFRKDQKLWETCRIIVLSDVLIALGTAVNRFCLDTFDRRHRTTNYSAVRFTFDPHGHLNAFRLFRKPQSVGTIHGLWKPVTEALQLFKSPYRLGCTLAVCQAFGDFFLLTTTAERTLSISFGTVFRFSMPSTPFYCFQ